MAVAFCRAAPSNRWVLALRAIAARGEGSLDLGQRTTRRPVKWILELLASAPVLQCAACFWLWHAAARGRSSTRGCRKKQFRQHAPGSNARAAVMDLSSEALASPPMPAPFAPFVEEAVPPRQHTASPTVLRQQQPASPNVLRTSKQKGPRLVARVLGARYLAGTPDPVARVWCGRIDATHGAEDQGARDHSEASDSGAMLWDAGNEFCFALRLDAPEDLAGGCCVVSLHDDRQARATGDKHGASLGEAVVPLRDVFARGRSDAAKQAVHLSATWFPLRDAPGSRGAAGDVLALLFLLVRRSRRL